MPLAGRCPQFHADGAEDQGMQNAAGAWNAEECFQMAGVIPHHGGTRSPRCNRVW